LFEVGVNGGLVTSFAGGVGGAGDGNVLVPCWLLVGLVVADGLCSNF